MVFFISGGFGRDVRYMSQSRDIEKEIAKMGERIFFFNLSKAGEMILKEKRIL